MEKGRISALQMAFLMYPAILATATLLVPAITAQSAGRDMWLSPFWGSLIGVITVLIAYFLHTRYPEDTFIQYSEKITGKFFGKLIGLLFLLFYLHITAIIVREYAEFIIGAFFLRTPHEVVDKRGIEVLGRCADFLVPILVLFILLLVILPVGEYQVENLLPTFEHGLRPSIEGAIAPQAWFSEFFLMAFLFPLINKKERNKSLKYGLLTVLSVMITMTLVNLLALLVFGELTETLLYPVMSAGRYIEIGEFFEHLESFVMVVWVAGTFLKVGVFYYVLSVGTAQWLGLSNYKPLVFPFGLLLVYVAMWSASNLMELKDFLASEGALYLTLVQTILPSFLCLIALFRKKERRSTQ
ncbi:endospore germination permease [Thalassobacillus sp. C254]|uniref:GerAB/ArcD/ProY family transporter n=1 Tax=Thalassobacillus sp. C254 TaxID=1225341 RepID=UPI0006D246F5|nr:endospore germination permease [Thalassobacillus sp. C254]